MAADSLFLLSEIATQVGLNVGATDDITLAKAKKWINRALLRFSEMGYWSWQRFYARSTATVASQEENSITDVVKITSIWISSPLQRKLELVPDRKFRALYPNNTATGTPYYWRRTGWSTSTVNTMKIGFYPIPDAIYTLKYDGIKPITLLTSDSQDIRLITGMPSNLVDLVIEMATAIGFKESDDVASAEQMNECMIRLKAAYGDDNSEIEDRLIMAQMETDLDQYFDPVLPPTYS